MTLSAKPDPANHPSIFNLALADRDQQVAASLTRELGRQRQEIELIASENIVSRAVLEAQGSIMTNKYAEGYPGRRYYGGCQYVDEVETLAIDRVKALFGCNYANVQPSSGSQANQAAFLATMRPGDCFMGLSLDQGGHLTHGARPNLSGKWFQPVFYGLDQKTGLIDYDALGEIAEKAKPAVIIAGGSGYSRTIDFAAFAKVAEAVGAYLMVDMAHIAGLIAGGVHPSPFPHAHIVTSTTHKTLRGPRGGLILSNDEQIARKIDSAVFPGLQGGPLMHAIAAKAVAFGEAQSDDFRAYSRQVVENASALASILSEGGSDIGVSIVSGGTDNHLMLVDLSESGLTGKEVEAALGRANITCNKNGVPGDKRNPTVTSGVRLGTPAVTSRGFGVPECQEVGRMILKIVDALARQASDEERTRIEQEVKDQALKLTGRFPIY